MKALIVASKTDLASLNIADNLIEHFDFEKKGEVYFRKNCTLVYVDEEPTNFYIENIKADSVIALSRHESKKAERIFTVHTPGIISQKVAIAEPFLLKALLKQLIENNTVYYQIHIEATHHGPVNLPCPVVFVEIGSDMNCWRDKEAGYIVAKSIIEALSNYKREKPAIGFGGLHYAYSFRKFVLSSDYAVGHIVPKYLVDKLKEADISELFAKSPDGSIALIDWKSMRSAERNKLIVMLENLGFNYKILGKKARG